MFAISWHITISLFFGHLYDHCSITVIEETIKIQNLPLETEGTILMSAKMQNVDFSYISAMLDFTTLFGQKITKKLTKSWIGLKKVEK